jgi:uncharacterized protein (TIGR02147 family)
MSVFFFQDYKAFITDHIHKLPRKGRGEISRIAKILGVHQTLISLVLTGERDLTLEQGHDLATDLGLSQLEQEYFLLLIQSARSGNQRYKKFVQEKLDQIRLESQKLSKRVDHSKILSDQERSVIYSSWIYSAVRLFCSTDEKGRTIEEVQKRFQLSRSRALDILNFLEHSGLVNHVDDQYKMGSQRTFLEQGSPHLLKHYANWRLKALQRADHLTGKELMFTSPVSISKADFEKLREQMASFVQEFLKTAEASPAEELACFNLDFFWID